MKKYEIGFKAGDDFEESQFILWLQTDGKVEAPGAVYCKEIEVGDHAPGVDVIIHTGE